MGLAVGHSPDASVDPTAKIGADVRIEAGARIEPGAIIGDRSMISENCVIRSAAQVGNDCLIKPNTTTGARGFVFADNEDRLPVSFPHIGGVVIGKFVEIGAKCTVARVALDDTVIGDYVKIDDHVYIAHNCIIGARSKTSAGSFLRSPSTMIKAGLTSSGARSSVSTREGQ